ncbi:beta-N-acetylglucosaminidase domain-containing protein [Paenibacillus terrigena]|uniref:beta-N-acetylglucosaminidase domain-containing protein n=1 Tax=Paenibacillus terrigena TaxID=369333 RepID=UPI0028D8A207|nr:beta-N-acetylglucosaminidase domain-containing protein [Paenibacillus terrigena]
MNYAKSNKNKKTLSRSISFVLALALAIPMFTMQGSTVSAAEASQLPEISPIPQSIQSTGDGFVIPSEVGIVTGSTSDPAAVQSVEEILRKAGVQHINRVQDSAVPNSPVNVWVGGPSENQATAAALQSLGAAGPDDLKDEGYVLASGTDTSGKPKIVLAGKTTLGTFYAAQTLRQLITAKDGAYRIPSVTIRDWPKMAWRGSIEGFYGDPWSHQDRLRQIDFYGQQKMNMYIYAPKDDPYHRDKWREAYPAAKLAEIAELVQRSKENHVELVFAISPGNSVCFSDDADFGALTTKAQAMWDVGVRSFAIFLDDIDKTLRCNADKTKFNSDTNPVAAAQAFLLNRFKTEFIDKHAGAHRLITVPTDYANITATAYINRFAALVDPSIIVQWTGSAVVPAGISASDADKANAIYKHDLLIWDNFPVNDYARDRLYLGPLYNRDAELADHGIIGLTTNPMNEAEASKIAIFTIADYLWNPAAYNPETAWQLSLKRFGGEVADALRIFAENNYSSPLNAKESLTIKPQIDNLWTVFIGGGSITNAANQLIAEFTKLQQAPATLRSGLNNPDFIGETKFYLDKYELYGQAGVEATQMLLSQKRNNKQQSAEHRTALNTVRTQINAITKAKANQVFEDYISRAIRENDNWLGVGTSTPFPITTMGTYQTNTPAKMLDGNLNTYFWSNNSPAINDVIGVDLNEVRKVSNVQVLMSKSGSVNDYVHHGVLEYSVDGANWTQLATLEEKPEISVPLDNQKARFVRIRVTGTQEYWVIVREFIVTSTAIPKEPTAVLGGDDTVQGDKEFKLQLGVENVTQSVYAQDLAMNYDANVMEFVSAKSLEDGVNLLETGKDTPGKLRFILASEGPGHAITGDKQLLELTFKAKKVSQMTEGTISISNATLADQVGAESNIAVSSLAIQVNPTPSDKTELNNLIRTVQAAYDAAVEGTQIGQYPAGSKAKLLTAIQAAQAVANNASATVDQVVAAIQALQQALDTFKASVITTKPGDVNGDGKVSIGDLAMVAAHYGKTSSSPDWEQVKKMDINGDNVIDIKDLAAIASKIIE